MISKLSNEIKQLNEKIQKLHFNIIATEKDNKIIFKKKIEYIGELLIGESYWNKITNNYITYLKLEVNISYLTTNEIESIKTQLAMINAILNADLLPMSISIDEKNNQNLEDKEDLNLDEDFFDAEDLLFEIGDEKINTEEDNEKNNQNRLNENIRNERNSTKIFQSNKSLRHPFSTFKMPSLSNDNVIKMHNNKKSDKNKKGISKNNKNIKTSESKKKDKNNENNKSSNSDKNNVNDIIKRIPLF